MNVYWDQDCTFPWVVVQQETRPADEGAPLPPPPPCVHRLVSLLDMLDGLPDEEGSFAHVIKLRRPDRCYMFKFAKPHIDRESSESTILQLTEYQQFIEWLYELDEVPDEAREKVSLAFNFERG